MPEVKLHVLGRKSCTWTTLTNLHTQRLTSFPQQWTRARVNQQSFCCSVVDVRSWVPCNSQTALEPEFFQMLLSHHHDKMTDAQTQTRMNLLQKQKPKILSSLQTTILCLLTTSKSFWIACVSSTTNVSSSSSWSLPSSTMTLATCFPDPILEDKKI